MSKLTKKWRKDIIKFIMNLSVIAVVAFGAFFIKNFPLLQAQGNDLCEQPVDAVLVMDTSGSMAEDGQRATCLWWKIECIQDCSTPNPIYGWVSHTTYDVDQSWCDAKSIPPSRLSTYLPYKPNKLEAAKEAAKSFIDNLGPTDQSGIVFYNTTASLAKGLSGDHNATKATIDGLAAQGATNIGDALKLGNEELGSARANPQALKTMILITDGMANKPNGDGYNENPLDVAYAESMATQAAGLGYKIFTIGLGSNGNFDEVMLQNIANTTGAQYYYSPTQADLDEIYNSIAWRLCQYGSISGCKYSDINNDGQITGESKLSGWEIILNNNDHLTQLTDGNGCYQFSGLLPGAYTVSEGGKLGAIFKQTYPGSKTYSLNLAEGENIIDKDFGNYLPICGNKIIDSQDGEVCEIGNKQNCTTTDGYAGEQSCKADCSGWNDCVPGQSCGDGQINNNEECDGQAGVPDIHHVCTSSCTLEYLPYCGDNTINQPTEQCDGDAPQTCQTISGYSGQMSCSGACLWSSCQTSETCGDGVKNGPEICDDGTNNGKYGYCNNDCTGETPSVCGNGAKEGSEECDDGNLTNGDGCNSQCALEQTTCTQQNNVVINELMWPGSALSNMDEWIELRNLSASQIDLSNCQLTRKSSGVEILMLTIPAGKFIEPNGYFVISNYDKNNSYLNIDPNLVETDVSLANSNLQIKLYCCNTWDNGGTLIDTADDGNGAPLKGSSNPNKSMQRKLTPGDGSQGGNWCTASTQVNWDTGVAELGTPGAINDCESAPVCGNQIIETGETCDDGNTTDGDGCSSLCAAETPPVLGSISGYKYQDTDGDLNTTNDWAGAGNWTINLFNSVSTTTPIATTTTNSQGYYIFNNLGAGDYDLSEDLLLGWTQLSAPTSTIHLLAGASSTENNFINYQKPSPLFGLISGYKYQDADGNASTTADQTGSPGWTINLFNSISTTTPVATTTSGNQGYYIFNNLSADDYSLSENLLTGWSQLSAPTSTIHLLTGASSTLNNFINYQPAPVCGNGIKEGNEECDGGAGVPAGMRCNSDCQVVRAGDGGGGGAGGGGEENGNDGTNGGWGGGGGGGANVSGSTTTSTTSGSSQPTVLGAEGKPELAIDKTVGVDFANPGDEVEYTVKITNNGNLTAYNVNLSDTLPAGLTFLFGGAAKTFTIGDIAPGESKTTVYKVKVDKAADAGVYSNLAQAAADNNDPVSDSANLEVRKVKVLGEELAPTGFDKREFIYLIIILSSLISSIIVLRKKYQGRKVTSNW